MSSETLRLKDFTPLAITPDTLSRALGGTQVPITSRTDKNMVRVIKDFRYINELMLKDAGVVVKAKKTKPVDPLIPDTR